MRHTSAKQVLASRGTASCFRPPGALPCPRDHLVRTLRVDGGIIPSHRILEKCQHQCSIFLVSRLYRSTRPAHYGRRRTLRAGDQEQCLCCRGNDFIPHRGRALRLVCQRHLEKRLNRRSSSGGHWRNHWNRHLCGAIGRSSRNTHIRNAVFRCNRTGRCGNKPVAYSTSDRRVGITSSTAHLISRTARRCSA